MWIHDIVMVTGKAAHDDVHDIVFSSLSSGYGTAVEKIRKLCSRLVADLMTEEAKAYVRLATKFVEDPFYDTLFCV